MPLTVRLLRPEETRRYLEIHREAVRGLAAADYSAAVIDAWAPLPITEAHVRALQHDASEIRLIAEIEGDAVGIGALVVNGGELRACYVSPRGARQGVGRAIVADLERRARAHGLRELRLVASLNAEPFYAALGYEAVERTEHVLRTGTPMAAVRMRKRLAG